MIKIEKIGSKAGFKKEQIADIAGQLLEVLNKKDNIKYFEKALFQVFKKDIKEAWKNRTFRIIYELQHGDDIVIKVKNTGCKLTIYNSYEAIFNTLKRLNVKLTSDLTVKNTLYEKIKNLCNNKVLNTIDAYSDGNFAILKDYVGAIAEEEKEEENIVSKRTLKSFMTDNLIKIDNYNQAKKIKYINTKNKYFVIYKNENNYHVFNQKYVDLFKDCEFYLDNTKNMLIVIKEEKIVGLIMAMSNKFINYKDLELLPQIENNTADEIINKNDVIKEENIVKYPIVVYQENTMPAAVEKSKELTKEELKELVTSGVMTDIEYIEALKDIKVIEHKNAVTGHIYKGNNAELLDNAMKDNNYKESLWLASGQAKKMNKQVKAGASGVLIKVYYEDESGRSFCKLEKIYNVAELEPIQKIENTEKYKNLVEKLRA